MTTSNFCLPIAPACASAEAQRTAFCSSSADRELEAQIDYQALLLHTVATPEERRAACDELSRLVKLRTMERVAQMERERNLR